MRRVIGMVMFIVTGLLLFMKNAYAYLDPGTGSMMLQALIAGIAAVLVAIRLYWDKFKRLFSFRSRNNEPPEGERIEEGE